MAVVRHCDEAGFSFTGHKWALKSFIVAFLPLSHRAGFSERPPRLFTHSAKQLLFFLQMLSLDPLMSITDWSWFHTFSALLFKWGRFSMHVTEPRWIKPVRRRGMLAGTNRTISPQTGIQPKLHASEICIKNNCNNARAGRGPMHPRLIHILSKKTKQRGKTNCQSTKSSLVQGWWAVVERVLRIMHVYFPCYWKPKLIRLSTVNSTFGSNYFMRMAEGEKLVPIHRPTARCWKCGLFSSERHPCFPQH